MSNEAVTGTPFTLNLVPPFSTFKNGKPKSIPYLVDGLLPSGAFSVLAGKPKKGKSSLARFAAVCVAKGMPFLGRDTQRGEVLLVSLEDPIQHVDNCLGALSYDPRTDSPIHIVTKLSPRIDESLAALDDAVSKNRNIRLIVVDTLAKLLRSDDLNDYAKVMHGAEKISGLARKHPHLHIQGLAHAKKLKTDDPFDSLLGSTALRGEPDSTIVLYDDRGQRVIATETRIGRSIPPTIIRATEVESAGAHVVSGYSLDLPFADWQKTQGDKAEEGREATHEERIIAFLQQRWDHSATHSDTLAEVKGRTERKVEAIKSLIEKGVITVTGTKQSKSDPLVLHLHESAIGGFLDRFLRTPGEQHDAD